MSSMTAQEVQQSLKTMERIAIALERIADHLTKSSTLLAPPTATSTVRPITPPATNLHGPSKSNIVPPAPVK